MALFDRNPESGALTSPISPQGNGGVSGGGGGGGGGGDNLSAVAENIIPVSANAYTVGSASLPFSEGHFGNSVFTSKIRNADNEILVDCDEKSFYGTFARLAGGSDPATPADGMIYYNVNDNELYLRKSGAWVTLGSGGGGGGGIPVGSSTVAGDADVTFGDGTDSEFKIFSKRFSVSNKIRIIPIDIATRNSLGSQPGDLVYINDAFNSVYELQLYDGYVWAQVGGGGGGGANTTLSNLSATSVNQDLVPDANGRSLGDTSQQWLYLFLDSQIRLSDNTTVIDAGQRTLNDTGSHPVLDWGAQADVVILRQNSSNVPRALRFEDSGNVTPNTVDIVSASELTSSYVLTLPVDAGTAGQVLSTDGSGILSWIAAGGGGGGIPKYADEASLPVSPANYDTAITLDNGGFYTYISAATAWFEIFRFGQFSTKILADEIYVGSGDGTGGGTRISTPDNLITNNLYINTGTASAPANASGELGLSTGSVGAGALSGNAYLKSGDAPSSGTSGTVTVRSGDAVTSGSTVIGTGDATNSGSLLFSTGVSTSSSGLISIVSGTGSTSGGVSLSSGNGESASGSLNLGTGSTTNSGGSSGGLTVYTGGSDGPTGSIELVTGLSDSSNRGNILLSGRNVALTSSAATFNVGSFTAQASGGGALISALKTSTQVGAVLLANFNPTATPAVISLDYSGATNPGFAVATANVLSGSSGELYVQTGTAPNTGELFVLSGNASTGASGPVTIQTGTAGTTRGNINLRAFRVDASQSEGPLRVPNLSADPASPLNGDIWYNTTSTQLKARVNGSTVVLA